MIYSTREDLHGRAHSLNAPQTAVSSGPVGCGFCGLLILDLSPTAHQLMFSADETGVMVLNSQDTNYVIRSEESVREG